MLLVFSFFHNFCDFYLPTDNSRTEELPSSPPILTVIFKSLNLNLDIFLDNDFLILIFRNNEEVWFQMKNCENKKTEQNAMFILILSSAYSEL